MRCVERRCVGFHQYLFFFLRKSILAILHKPFFVQLEQIVMDQAHSINKQQQKKNDCVSRYLYITSKQMSLSPVEEGLAHLRQKQRVDSDDGCAKDAATPSKPQTTAALASYEIEVAVVPKAATKSMPTPSTSTEAVKSVCMTKSGSFDSGSATLTLPQRYALSIARSPIKHLSISFAIVAAVSLIGLTLGDVQIEFIGGWFTQG